MGCFRRTGWESWFSPRKIGRSWENTLWPAASDAATIGLDSYCSVFAEQDSKKVKGLQLADLTAHILGLMPLDGLGILPKTVKAGPNSGYDPEMDIELGSELWAGLRHRFFTAGPMAEQDEVYRGALLRVGDNGLLVAPTCDGRLSLASIGETVSMNRRQRLFARVGQNPTRRQAQP